MRFPAILPALVLPLLAAACAPDDTPAAPEPTVAAPPPAREPPPAETLGGPPIRLSPLTGDEARLAGELRCAFAGPDGNAILIAAADVDPNGRASGVMRANGTVETLVGRVEGGFDALAKRASLGTKGLTVEVTRGAAIPTGHEGSRHRATLRIDRADGAEATYPGTWTCGP